MSATISITQVYRLIHHEGKEFARAATHVIHRYGKLRHKQLAESRLSTVENTN